MDEHSTINLQCLLDRLAAGDHSARDQFISHAYERLHRLAQRALRNFPRLRPFDEPTDVLHQSFSRLRRVLDAASPRTTVADFFRLAAWEMRRELLDQVDHYFGPEGPGGKELRQSDVGDSAGTPHEPVQETTDVSNLFTLEDWTEFHAAVHALPPAERAAFELVWYHELTQAKAAEVLRCAEITVRRRWLAARRRLGAMLQIQPTKGLGDNARE